MQTFAEFLSAQEEMFASFEREMQVVREEGIIPDPAIRGKKCGFFVNLTPSVPVTRRIAKLSRELGAAASLTVREEADVHTTLASAIVSPECVINPRGVPVHRDILNGLVAVARGAIAALGARLVVIHYDRYLFNQKVTVVGGTPNEAFVELVHRIAEGGTKLGIDLRPTRHANITLGRSTIRRLPEELGNFFHLIETASIPGESVPVRLNVWYNNYEPALPLGHREVAYISIPLIQ